MSPYIALLRGINVGKNSALLMEELISIIEDIGCINVRTYIQSGNAVFLSEDKDTRYLAGRISEGVGKRRGFEPYVLVLGIDEIDKAINQNPFPESETNHKSVHLCFMGDTVEKPDLNTLDCLKKDNERFLLKDKVFYLFAPEGVGRSRLFANMERVLGVPVTSRNWKTVCKIREMAMI